MECTKVCYIPQHIRDLDMPNVPLAPHSKFGSGYSTYKSSFQKLKLILLLPRLCHGREKTGQSRLHVFNSQRIKF